MSNDLMGDTWIPWIPFLPFASALLHAVLIGMLRRSLSPRMVSGISCGAVAGSLLLTCVSFAEMISLPGDGAIQERLFSWIGLGVGSAHFDADIAFRFDALSAVMCLVITGVGLLIHIYSVGYLQQDQRDDRGFQRFFCYMNLFIAAMLVLVLADNLLLMFLGWEGVGLCSYLLIGFWYGDREKAQAGTKAFIVNRIGDLGFLVGTLLLFWSLSESGTPTMSFRGIEGALPVIVASTLSLPAWLGGGEFALANAIGLCFFLGACGKSAQLPLFVWLPDAMAGPTPVSALIHAATMVTAGVYMIARLSFLYAVAPEASTVIAWTGAVSALFAATIACVQSDIKKVLAYSTISQLGYMFLAAGVGAYTAAMYHVVTHAFFKALLFLCAGVVIMVLKHEQDMRRMGGIGSRLPWTRRWMWIGVGTIAGVPLTAGFFSKDQILVASYAAHEVPGHIHLYWMALTTVALTAFYSVRLIYVSLYGTSQVPAEVRREIHEPGGLVLWPLGILAVLCILGSLLGVPQLWGDLELLRVEESNSIHHFLARVVAVGEPHELDASTEWGLTGRAIAMFALGSTMGVILHLLRPAWADWLAGKLSFAHRLVKNAYYVDALYRGLIVRPLLAASDRLLFRWIDVRLIDGLAVMGSANLLRGLTDGLLKYTQVGLAQVYFLVMLLGSLAILVYLLFESGA